VSSPWGRDRIVKYCLPSSKLELRELSQHSVKVGKERRNLQHLQSLCFRGCGVMHEICFREGTQNSTWAVAYAAGNWLLAIKPTRKVFPRFPLMYQPPETRTRTQPLPRIGEFC
jgi:hypothetical protein